LTYVSADNPASLGPILTNEIVEIVTKLVVQAQNGIYGMTEIADRYGVSRKARNQAIRDINIEYISAVLGREGFYEQTYVGLGDGLSYKEYYTCVFVILLMLLWGIACSAMLIKHDMALSRILTSSGYRMSTMVIGDYIPFLIMMCVNTCLLLVIGGTYLEIDGLSLFSRMIPMIVLLTTMQFFLYEIATNIISGVLMQLFVVVLLSYASGFFYPIYSLPGMIQTVSKMLPTGLSFRYLSEILQGKTGMEVLPMVWLYSILFILLSMVVRQYKIRSNKYD
jgi:ABC-2 type transport system permease protein